MFGERLKMLRVSSGYSQTYVANKVNIARESYSMYERDLRNPPYEVLIALANLFGVSIDYLLGETDYKISFKNLNPTKQRVVSEIVSCSEDTASIIASIIGISDSLKQDESRRNPRR